MKTKQTDRDSSAFAVQPAERKIFEGRTEAGSCLRLVVEGQRITAATPIPDHEDLPWILPVLVDLQNNGGLGKAYNSYFKPDPSWLRAQAGHLRRHGVGRCLATLTTLPLDRLVETGAALGRCLDADPDLNTLFFGIFHEGIFISPRDGWRGAHNREWVARPDYDHIRRLDEVCGRRVRIVNVAPEEPGGLDFIDDAVADGKQVALGHCGPDAATVHEAVARGARLVTHFGNGAPPLIHRHRNPFWAFLSRPELTLGLVGDGFHLPPELVRAALAAKGPDGCFAVSDANARSGCPPGRYAGVAGNTVVIEPDGHMHLQNSEILSGAWFNLDRCVEFLIRDVGLPFLEAWRLCSRLPAANAGIELPEMAPGNEASFVLARWRDGLILEQCVHRGLESLERPARVSGPASDPASGD